MKSNAIKTNLAAHLMANAQQSAGAPEYILDCGYDHREVSKQPYTVTFGGSLLNPRRPNRNLSLRISEDTSWTTWGEVNSAMIDEGTKVSWNELPAHIREHISKEKEAYILEMAGVTTSRVCTKSPAFIEWFDGSKAVGANGEPLIAYHGSGVSITSFFSNRGSMIFFARTPRNAAGYAQCSDDNQRELGNYEDEFGLESEDGGAAVYPVFLSIKKPFDQDNAQHIAEVLLQIPESYEKTLMANAFAGGDYGFIEDHQEYLQKAGFDSVYVCEHDGLFPDERDIAVFSPGQIKSAIGNCGNFNANSKLICE